MVGEIRRIRDPPEEGVTIPVRVVRGGPPPPLSPRVLWAEPPSRRLAARESSSDKAQHNRDRFPGEEPSRGLSGRNRPACTLADESPSRSGTLPRLSRVWRSPVILRCDSQQPAGGGLPAGCPVAEKRRQFGAGPITSRRQVCAAGEAKKPRNLNGKRPDSGCRAGLRTRRRVSVVGGGPGRGGA